MLSCRQARLEDAETLFAMVRELAAHEDSLAALHTDLQRFRQDGFGPQARFAAVLAEVDGQPAGYISYTHAYAIWRGVASLNVDDIYVRAAFRRQGVGEALLRRLRDVAARDGACRLRWEVNVHNAGAIRFYERLGAVVTPKGLCRWEIADLEPG